MFFIMTCKGKKPKTKAKTKKKKLNKGSFISKINLKAKIHIVKEYPKEIRNKIPDPKMK